MARLTVNRLCAQLGISRATLYRRIADTSFPPFPKPQRDRRGRNVWEEAEIAAWRDLKKLADELRTIDEAVAPLWADIHADKSKGDNHRKRDRARLLALWRAANVR